VAKGWIRRWHVDADRRPIGDGDDDVVERDRRPAVELDPAGPEARATRPCQA